MGATELTTPNERVRKRTLAVAFCCSLGLLISLLAPAGARAEVQEFDCRPLSVAVSSDRIEVHCSEVLVLDNRTPDRFREVDRFAVPLVKRTVEPQFGSQIYLVNYFLAQCQEAVVHGKVLRIQFESDLAISPGFDCDPTHCREIVSLSLLANPPAAEPDQLDQP